MDILLQILPCLIEHLNSQFIDILNSLLHSSWCWTSLEEEFTSEQLEGLQHEQGNLSQLPTLHL